MWPHFSSMRATSLFMYAATLDPVPTTLNIDPCKAKGFVLDYL